MNRDDILRMAREAAEATGTLVPAEWNEPLLERFANLVAAAEREACLSIMRDMEGRKWRTVIHGGEMKGVSLHDAYAAIRARGPHD